MNPFAFHAQTFQLWMQGPVQARVPALAWVPVWPWALVEEGEFQPEVLVEVTALLEDLLEGLLVWTWTSSISVLGVAFQEASVVVEVEPGEVVEEVARVHLAELVEVPAGEEEEEDVLTAASHAKMSWDHHEAVALGVYHDEVVVEEECHEEEGEGALRRLLNGNPNSIHPDYHGQNFLDR
jgi:hypothetical protein